MRSVDSPNRYRTDTGSVPTPAGVPPELVSIKHDLHASISAHAGLFDWIYKRNNKFYTLSSPGSSSRPGLGVPPPVPPPGLFPPEPEPEPFPPPCFEPEPVDFPLGSGTTTSLPLEITTQMGLLPATFNRYARFRFNVSRCSVTLTLHRFPPGERCVTLTLRRFYPREHCMTLTLYRFYPRER